MSFNNMQSKLLYGYSYVILKYFSIVINLKNKLYSRSFLLNIEKKLNYYASYIRYNKLNAFN